MAEVVRILPEILEKMIAHARLETRAECCGLLAGRDGVITEIFQTTNALKSATTFEIPPQELFDSFRKMRERGLDHLGIYHSHLASDNFPSPRDIDQAFYPGVAYFIVSPQGNSSRPVRAFRIADARVVELEIHVFSA